MKAKLIKTEKGYYLDTGKLDGVHLACYPHSIDKQKLSLKNCQAIERGYDLDDLASNYTRSKEFGTRDTFEAYEAGFQKALELMGDKKFTEEDVRKAMDRVWDWCEYDKDEDCSSMTELRDKHIQSLQQTEWEVGIEMEKVPNMDYKPSFGGGSDSHYNPMYVSQPKLDKDGCLILRRT